MVTKKDSTDSLEIAQLPIYMELLKKVTLNIARGDYGPCGGIPPVRELGGQNVASGAAVKLFKILRERGLVEVIPDGRSHVVAGENGIKKAQDEITKFYTDEILKLLKDFQEIPDSIRERISTQLGENKQLVEIITRLRDFLDQIIQKTSK